MKVMGIYYTYAYLRKNGTPYYIGKGCRGRAYHANHNVKVPCKKYILILKKSLSEEEAIRHEIYMIAILGRKQLGTGILRNLTDGGEGISGYKHSEQTKQKIGVSNSVKKRSAELRERISKSVRGFKWYNNGEVSIQARLHPGAGWEEGRIINWATPKNAGMRWYYKGNERKMASTSPGEGWTLGLKNRSTENNHTNGGKKWYNNGEINRMFATPPEGWSLGMIRRKHG
jgi:hypothetical protein